ncbi:MAG: adenylate/guanylate cyclase domain-containing protein [Selenomonadaceae bacterium]|nr:adenylate/guanylate cyclase domain-containing protein [Selenomonadaceae bacterium]
MKNIEALLIAALITAIAATETLDDLDYRISDWLYQKTSEANSDIVVVGIDSITLNKLGVLSSWIRRDIAKVITYLNENDPTARPAVIGIDLIFTGENSQDPEADRQLVETIAKYDNVVLTSLSNAKEDSNDRDPFAMWNKTWQEELPFQALAEVADVGHICEPIDSDGLLRHQLLYMNVAEHGQRYSFARVIYEKFCKAKGITPNQSPITERNGIFYLPFTAKSYSQGVNFIDLLEGKIDSDFYRDKVILIGHYALGMGDEFTTVLDKSSFVYGVDIHANAIQAFQNGFFPREAAKSLQLIILFLICFATGLFFRVWKVKNVLALWLIISSGWLILCKIFYYGGIILHALWVPLAVSVLFVGSVTINYVRARAESDKLTATFERYVDPTIMSQLLNGGADALDLGGTMRNIAVLFVDIRGFTTMSEQLAPSVVVEILNQYLTLTTDCIRRHHGTLDKFVGDCTMAFWNAPITQKQPVLLACRAALDMIKGSEKLRAELKERYGREISFGVGVHWGRAVVGNIGSPFRMDYTAIGDTVNTAARLEANAPGGKIYISRAVADILGNRADVTSLGDSVKLKGKARGFEVLTLNSLVETEDE